MDAVLAAALPPVQRTAGHQAGIAPLRNAGPRLLRQPRAMRFTVQAPRRHPTRRLAFAGTDLSLGACASRDLRAEGPASTMPHLPSELRGFQWQATESRYFPVAAHCCF